MSLLLLLVPLPAAEAGSEDFDLVRPTVATPGRSTLAVARDEDVPEARDVVVAVEGGACVGVAVVVVGAIPPVSVVTADTWSSLSCQISNSSCASHRGVCPPLFIASVLCFWCPTTTVQ